MINICDAEFDFESVKDQIVGGGILPVSIDEHGIIRILLGKERYINNWRGSLKWSGFEGGKKVDESPEHIAAREFLEESMGLVSLDDCEKTSIMDNVLQIIQNEKYFLRILLCIEHENITIHNIREYINRFHVTYVIQIPYKTSYVDDFTYLRRQLSEFQTKLTNFQKLNELVSNEYPYLKEEQIIQGKKVKAIVQVELDQNILIITYLEEEGLKCIKKDVSSLIDCDLYTYIKWFQSRESLNNDIEYLQKFNCIHIEKNCLGFFVNATVNDEYIEKQQIAWWSLESLEKVFVNGGYSSNDYFRAYFLPVLQRTIQELKNYNKGHNNSHQ